MQVAPAKSSTEQLRRANSVLILKALRRHGKLSHTGIVEETLLSSATVSAITNELVQSGIIEQSHVHTQSGRGRPRLHLQPARGYGYLATIVISADVVDFSLVDYSGTILDRISEIRDQRSDVTEPFVALLNSGLERLRERSKLGQNAVLAISVSSKGIVDTNRPLMKWSPIFGDKIIDFETVFPAYRHAAIVLSNETALVAGALFNRNKDTKNGLAVVSLGHSIGLGLIAPGGTGTPQAPNFGHMLHMPDGARCRCGSRGCVEAYAGFYAILRTAFEVPEDTVPAKFVPVSEVERISQNARRGDRKAAYAFRQVGVAIGNGLSRLLSLYGRVPIVITGPGVSFYDLLREGLESGLRETHVARMEGMPEIRIEANEAELIFEGHTGLGLDILDEQMQTGIHSLGRSTGRHA